MWTRWPLERMIKMDRAQILASAEKIGFEAIGTLEPATLSPREEVRDMCASGKCKEFGKRWSCPPGCGSLEECTARFRGFDQGLLLQSVAQLEDCFDGEGMMRAEELHKQRLFALREALRGEPHVLVVGAGCCTVCAQCTYPGEPCRFPDRMIVSMEACGLLVSQVLKENNMAYYYGSDKIAYTGCVLF